jgi:membrane carboxypeptidase/penicillin-binding protein
MTLKLNLPRLYQIIASIGEAYSINHKSNNTVARRLGIPVHLIHLILMVEDKRFWIHPGIDPISILRAISMWALSKGCRQGASTIPEQVVKLRKFRLGRTTIWERIQRAFFGVVLISHLPKEDILIEYLNRVYLGKSCYGVKAAAHSYFGCTEFLTPAQSLFIADRIALPNHWRYGRLVNILMRPSVCDVLSQDICELPKIYGMNFGQQAEAAVRNILKVLSYDCSQS